LTYSRWGRRLAAVYLLAVVFLAGFVTYRVYLASTSSDLSVVLLILAGMPWTSLLGQALGQVGPLLAIPVILLGIGLNTLLLYFLGTGLERLAWHSDP